MRLVLGGRSSGVWGQFLEVWGVYAGFGSFLRLWGRFSAVSIKISLF